MFIQLVSSSFRLFFLGCLERLLALHRGHIGAFLCICWWHERHDFIGGGCCLNGRPSRGVSGLLTRWFAAAVATMICEATE